MPGVRSIPGAAPGRSWRPPPPPPRAPIPPRAQTAVQTVANVGWQNPVAEPDGATTSSPPIEQAFIVTVTGSGNVSASAQIVGSNDTVNWALYGPVIAVASGASPQSQSAVGNI